MQPNPQPTLLDMGTSGLCLPVLSLHKVEHHQVGVGKQKGDNIY